MNDKKRPPGVTGRVKRMKPYQFVYGDIGTGKSSYAAGAPNPIFLPTENGLKEIEVDRFPIIESFDEIIDNFDLLMQGEYGYETIVIDTIDGLCELAIREICQTQGVKTIGEANGGYGRGPSALRPYFERLNNYISFAIHKGIGVIVLAHSTFKKISPPDRPEYTRYYPAMESVAVDVLTREADAVLYAYRPSVVKTVDGDGKKKVGRSVAVAVKNSLSQWMMSAVNSPASIAKNRYGITDDFPTSYAEFERLYEAHQVKMEKQ